MSVKLMTAIWANGPSNSTERFVLLTLADFANDDGAGVYPAFATIAERCALSRRTVIRAVESLIETGYLQRRRRKKDGRFTSSEYRINPQRLLGDGDRLSPYSDTVSLGWCQDDTRVVTDDHQGGDTVSPNPSSYPLVDPSNEPGERHAPAPFPFQPIPESLKRAKAKRGRDRPGDDSPVIPNAPPVLALLHRLTSYWPGDDNAGYLIGRLGDAPNEKALARAVELWRAAGYKPNNWIGICDFYDEVSRDPAWTPNGRYKQSASGKSVAQPQPTEGYTY